MSGFRSRIGYQIRSICWKVRTSEKYSESRFLRWKMRTRILGLKRWLLRRQELQFSSYDAACMIKGYLGDAFDSVWMAPSPRDEEAVSKLILLELIEQKLKEKMLPKSNPAPWEPGYPIYVLTWQEARDEFERFCRNQVFRSEAPESNEMVSYNLALAKAWDALPVLLKF